MRTVAAAVMSSPRTGAAGSRARGAGREHHRGQYSREHAAGVALRKRAATQGALERSAREWGGVKWSGWSRAADVPRSGASPGSSWCDHPHLPVRGDRVRPVSARSSSCLHHRLHVRGSRGSGRPSPSPSRAVEPLGSLPPHGEQGIPCRRPACCHPAVTGVRPLLSPACRTLSIAAAATSCWSGVGGPATRREGLFPWRLFDDSAG